MATGLSIHIGLNQVDPGHYSSPRQLQGCVNDAREMAALAQARGFTPTVLLDQQATSAAVSEQLSSAAAQLGQGDILLVTYSGHGSFVDDTNQDENDGRDETWCLFDREIADDELYSLWAKFSLGTRIVILSDSCHSGSVAKFARDRIALKSRLASVAEGMEGVEGMLDIQAIRAVPASEAREIFQQNAQVYLDLQQQFPEGRAVDVNASVLVISACQDWETSLDGSPHGLFTKALLNVWNGGKFAGNYLDLHAAIYNLTRLVQHPNYTKLGVPNPAFETQTAFTI